MIIVYLAGPIDYSDDQSWKNRLIDGCDTIKDLAFFDPQAPYKVKSINMSLSQYIYDINMLALDRADILVGRLYNGQTSVGTPIEFHHCLEANKPMIIDTDLDKSVYMKILEINAKFVRGNEELTRELINMAKKIEEDRHLVDKINNAKIALNNLGGKNER